MPSASRSGVNSLAKLGMMNALVTQKYGIAEIGGEDESTITDNHRQGNASGLVRAACVVLESSVSVRRIPHQHARSTEARKEL